MRIHSWLCGTAAAMALLGSGHAVLAQSVSATLRGQVTAEDGTPVSGASVSILNTSTGATTVVTTGAGGTFNASGLQVGGPYTITVTADGYRGQAAEGVFLALGDPTQISLALAAADAAAAESVLVLGTRRSQDLIDTRGVSAQFNTAQIDAAPSIDTDFKEIVQQSPLAYVDPVGGGSNPPVPTVSILGSNPRCNSFIVDGLPQNDSFGLNNQGYPTARSPLPTDWAESVQVATAPYDVEYNDFCGGIINVVTKSGGNELDGSVYFYEKSDDVVGQKVRDREFAPATFQEERYGFTVSAPIIEDTLFFFFGWDNVERTTPVSIGPEGGPTEALEVNGVTQADVDQVIAIAQTVYDFDPLSLQDSFVEENERWIAKINWQITDDHRAQLTYGAVEGGTLNTRASRGSLPILGLPSNWYIDQETLEQYSVQVFSNWTDRFSTEFRAGRVDVLGEQKPLAGAEFPEIYVRTPGDGYIAIGPDQFRHFNILEYTYDVFKLTATLDLDSHVLKGGAERKTLDIFNGFVQGSDGIYRFDSITDFENGVLAAGNDTRFRTGRGREPVRYANSPTNNPADASAAFDYTVNSLFLQDDWFVTNDLSIAFGIRYDFIETDSEIVENPRFLADYGFSNTKNLDGLDIFLPRASFSWDLVPEWEDYPMAFNVRGGIGRFSGGAPNVWISNSYTNTGVNYVEVLGTPGVGGLATVPPDFLQTHGLNNLNDVPLVLQNLLASQPVGNGLVNALAPDFELPSTLRMNIGVDVEFGDGLLGEGWRFAMDYLRLEGEDQLYYFDVRSVETGTFAPDGRKLYTVNPSSEPTFDAISGSELVLANADEGEASYWSFELQKSWESDDRDVSFRIGYVNSDVTEMNPLTSSTASSNFSNRSYINYNDPTAFRSIYEREHRVTATFSWAEQFLHGFETRFSLFAQRTSGQPFSYTFRNNPFGGFGPSGRASLYVPQTDAAGNVTLTSDPLVTYAGGFNIDAFNSFLKGTGLIEYAGEIAPVNGFDGPWNSRIDLSIEQEVPVPFISDDHKVVFELDILNFGNLLNKDWGRYATPGFPQTQGVVNGTVVGGQYQYSSLSTSSIVSDRYPASVWQVQFGVRFEF